MSQVIEDLLAAGVSADQVERLVRQMGGLSVYLPRQYDPDRSAVCRELAETAGDLAARTLVQLYAGCRIVIPMGRQFMRQRLAARIHALRAAGQSVPQIARALHVHVRQVQRLLSGGAPDAP
ncbi:helix-turn-helix domain-containing protein [Thermomonas sp. S9]|uniref:helix-turn-helix domain-containing protein n=1 Tax=Thermomonas sp. S9 TaxID=2885203 RepID=UPI00216AE9BB|nr:helix-turn-helix domain-containing protein [Thermomonas sp. S9]MCR6494809.1 helix-turn-helix domain-containing protein [Thermomonas sp. S9]MCR6497068.1 helix-turn-helix domain-containing protein [Thermomonas sp. S9]MCR6497384.1 helix-turn-helix domain-containing protein [Thermomonas sp. S9]